MTRLIHLAAYEPDQRGSFVPFLLAVLSAARRRGWDVEAVFPKGARGRFWLSDFHRAEIPVAFASGSRRALTRWLDERLAPVEEPTVLHTHFTAYDVPAALVARGRPEAHVYWHIHTVLSDRPRAVAANIVKFGFLARYVDRILSPASNVAESVARRRGDRRKVSVFPNTIELKAFPLLSQHQRDEARRTLGVSPEARVLLHFGRDWQLKGGEVFLEALADLAGEGVPVLGLFSRAGSKARRFVEQRGLEDHVKMIDLLPDPQLLYGAADVMVAPSRGETMPFTVMESLCSGTPVVASDLPGHRVLGDALDACTIVPRQPAPFAAAIRSFLEMGSGERARLCGDARDWIATNFDVRAAAERLIEDYERSIEGGVGARRPTMARSPL